MQASARNRRQTAQEHGRRSARQGDPLHLAGCMLYWAEGSKRRNDVEFTNSDSDLVATFVRFLRECYSITSDDLRLTLNVHLNNGIALNDIEDWWLTRLSLSRRSLRSHTLNHSSERSSGSRRTLPHGTARVVLHSTFVVQSIYGAIQEYAGTVRPEWLEL